MIYTNYCVFYVSVLQLVAKEAGSKSVRMDACPIKWDRASFALSLLIFEIKSLNGDNFIF